VESPAAVGIGGADAALGSGLRGLADRRGARRNAAGRGTTVTAELPL